MASKFPISEQDILNQVLEEKQLSHNFVDSKRDLFRERLNLYTNIADQEHKIYVRLIRSVMQTLMGLYYTDEITTKFSGRQLWDDEYAENLNNLAEFDQEEMKLPQINYDTQWNRLFYWVWIRVFDYWDEFKKVPVFKSVDPMTWYPDPLWYMDNHRWHWFESEVADHELPDSIYMNISEIEPSNSEEIDKVRSRLAESRQLDQTDWQVIPSPIYTIYNHYTTIKGKQYLVTLTNNDSLIIRFEEITPVYEEEKNEWRVSYPVILNYYEPFRWDPFWISIPDILEDKQRSSQLFFNLNRIKAEHEAWGDTFLVDTNAINNLNDLKQHTFWPKYVRANNLKDNPNPIKAVDKGSVKQDAYNMPNVIWQQATSDIWLDERSLGISPAAWMSATENQRVQKNANIKLLLNNTINQWWEKAFWKLWLRTYYEYFEFTDEKNILLNNSFWQTLITVKREDINTWSNIDIKVINKSQEDEIKEKDKLALLTIAELVLQDPAVANISRTFAKRQIAKANWLDQDKISILFPPSPEEMDARSQLILLNDNEKLNPENIELTEDHLTYITIYQRAMDTEAKREAIETRLQAYSASWQALKQQQPQEQTWIAWISAQVANQAIQAWQPQGATSLQDVAQ